MRLRIAHAAAGALALAIAAPAMAGEGPGIPMPPPMPHHGAMHHAGPAHAGMPDMRPDWNNAQMHARHGGPDAHARDAWLAECRRNNVRADRGVGGGVIGGLLGGLLGNRIGGRGNRTVGTIAGAAVGAVAGVAIDRAEDRGRAREADYCEAYLDDYYARAAQHQAYYAVPMHRQAAPQQECTEEVTYEYVDVPVRQRRIYRAPVRRVPDKRIRTMPDKRIAL